MFSPRPKPSPHSKAPDLDAVFPGDSEMAERMRRFDWSRTSLGSVARWPDPLRYAVSEALRHELPMLVVWGPELLQLYNDAYAPVAGDKHPDLIGQPLSVGWAEIWDAIRPIFDKVVKTGQSHRLEDAMFRINRHGYLEEAWFTLSYAPIPDPRGGMGGASLVLFETTERVLFERRFRLLYCLGSTPTVGMTFGDVFHSVVETLERSRHVIPFALLYSVTLDGHAKLVADCGLAVDDLVRETWVDLNPSSISCWPLSRVIRQKVPLVVTDLRIQTRPPQRPTEQPESGVESTLVTQAVVSPVMCLGRSDPAALFVMGVNPLLPLNEDYQRFYALVTEQVTARLNAALTVAEVQQRADDEIRQSQRAYKSLADHSPDIIARFDRGLRCLYASPSLPTVLGGHLEDFVGKTPAETSLRQEEKALWTERLARVFVTGLEERAEITAVGPLGARYLDVLFAPEVVEQGRVETVVSHARDFTDRKRAEEELGRQREVLEVLAEQLGANLAELERQNAITSEARAEAERANRAKSEFLSRVSHELRTPLNAVLGFSQLLGEPGRGEADVVTFSGYIRQAGEHLLKVVDEVLDISRIGSGRLQLLMEPVSVRGVLDEVLHLTEPIAQNAGITLDTGRFGTCDVTVLADSRRLQQIVLNLVSNAIKFNLPNGIVYLYCRKVGERCRIIVEDTGPGISVEMQANLFGPFERLDAANRNIEGTGLGLALSRELASAMDGTLDLKSESGRGCTFWVELPLALDSVRSVNGCDAAGADFTAPDEAVHRKALYIEDNLPSLELIKQILKVRPEFELLTAMQGRLGIGLAIQHLPDVIFLDMNLPDVPGLEVLKILRADPRTREIPIIIISSDALPGAADAVRAVGVQAYLTKPFDLKRFLATLREVVPASLGEDSPKP